MTEEPMGDICPPSAVRWLNTRLRKLVQNPATIMGDYVNLGDTVVDLGCGGGYFAVALAEMVGENGRVIAMDVQTEMLNITRGYAAKKGVTYRITLHKCEPDDIGLPGEKVDFALAFYAVHEVPDRKAFFDQVAALLKPEARFLVIEPTFRVSSSQFEQILDEAGSAGLKSVKPVKALLSRGMLLTR